MSRFARMGLASVALWFAAGAVAMAGQMTILDRSYTHGGWYKHMKFDKQPDDWTSPHDYYHGETCVRFEVIRFNGPAQIGLHYCYFQDRHTSDKHACTSMVKVTAPGVYYRRWRNSEMWQENVIDWRRKLLNFMQIDNWVKGKGKAEVRVTVIIVAGAHRLRAPADWDCPKDWKAVPSGTYGGVSYKELINLPSVAALFEAGQLGPAYRAAGKHLSSKDPAKASEARRAIEGLDRHAQESCAALDKRKDQDPAGVLVALQKLAQQYGGSAKGNQLARATRDFARDPVVRDELAARWILESMDPAVKKMGRKLGGKKATDPKIAARYRRPIAEVQRHVGVLYRRHPNSQAFRSGVSAAERFGIPLPQEITAKAKEPAASPSYSLAELRAAPVDRKPSGTARQTRARVVSASDVKSRPDANIQRAWECKLQERITQAVAEGRKPSYRAGGDRIVVASIGADGKLSLRMNGLEMQMAWSRLRPRNRKDLAVSICRDDDPATCAIAAYFLLALGNKDAAEKYLRKGGKLATELRAMFNESQVRRSSPSAPAPAGRQPARP